METSYYGVLGMISADDINESMEMLLNGDIKKHTLKDDSPKHGKIQMKRETRIFKDFLPSKNAHMILNLKGIDEEE